MTTFPDTLVSALDVAAAIRWLAPDADELDEEGFECDDAPIAAMYAMEDGIPSLRTQCLDVLHSKGAHGLNRFLLDWCNRELDGVVDETRQLLYGVPTPAYGFDIESEHEHPNVRPLLDFICRLRGRTLPEEDTQEPVLFTQLPLLDLGDDCLPVEQYAGSDAAADDETDDSTDETDEYDGVSDAARRLLADLSDMSNTARLICMALTRETAPADARWQAVGWAVGWAFNVTGNTLADATWEELAEFSPASWAEWEDIKIVIDEARQIHDSAQQGLQLIYRSHLVRAWLAHNIRKCNGLCRTWSTDAHKHLDELTWPQLAGQPAGDPARDTAPL